MDQFIASVMLNIMLRALQTIARPSVCSSA